MMVASSSRRPFCELLLWSLSSLIVGDGTFVSPRGEGTRFTGAPASAATSMFSGSKRWSGEGGKLDKTSVLVSAGPCAGTTRSGEGENVDEPIGFVVVGVRLTLDANRCSESGLFVLTDSRGVV